MKNLIALCASMLALGLAAAPVAAAPRVAYSVYSPFSEHNVRTGIYTSAVDGSSRQRLTRGSDDLQALWSPDRTHIAFVRTRHLEPGPNRPLGRMIWALMVMNHDGERKTKISALSGDSQPWDSFDWSPDSTELVFERDGDLFIAGRDGTGERQLTDTAQPETEPSWSPDGGKISFTGVGVAADPLQPGPNADVFVMPAEGGPADQISTDPASDFAPEWSPDGDRIAFVSARGHCCDSEAYGSDIYVVSADGTGEVRLTDECTWKSSQQWLPDGSKLIYENHPDDDACPLPYWTSPLKLVDVDIKDERGILPKSWDAYGPALSPKGRWIAFSTTASENEGLDLFRVRVSDGRVGRITDNARKAHDVDPDW